MFREIELTDKELFDNLQMDDYAASELNFANILAWKNYDKLEIYNEELFIIIKGKDFFFPPLVKNTLLKKDIFNQALNLIIDYCRNNNFVFNILGITPELIPFFNVPNTTFYAHDELNEYLYNATDLINYRGKKFHSKRNLVNQFERNFQFQFVSYCEQYRSCVIDLIDNWTEQKSLTYEKEGILALLDNLEASGSFCDLIIIDNKVQAFSIGTKNIMVGIVLFEKANIDYIGIYPAMVTYFARKHFNNVKYINRQEDMGIENLRISKMSYNPCGFIKKSQLTKTINRQLEKIYHFSFNDSLSYEKYFFTSKEKQVTYITNNNIITSVLYYRDETLIINNQEVKVAFIFALATHPLYRHQGYMTKLLKKALQDLSEKYVLAYLHPDVKNFYEQFDFVYFGSICKGNEILTAPVTNLVKIKEIYDQVGQKVDGFIKRDLTRWLAILQEVKIDGGNIYIKDSSYQINDGSEIIEDISITAKLTKDNYNMVRILQLKSFLTIINKDFINYQITDNIINKNNITLLETENEKKITITAFSEIIFTNLLILALEKY